MTISQLVSTSRYIEETVMHIIPEWEFMLYLISSLNFLHGDLIRFPISEL